jgi:hypothetical protein
VVLHIQLAKAAVSLADRLEELQAVYWEVAVGDSALAVGRFDNCHSAVRILLERQVQR